MPSNSPQQERARPFVSVMMPVYNTAPYLAQAIESVLGQSHEHLELVVVDDCSTDGSWDIVQHYARRDPRVRAFRNESNLKIVQTRNRALREANPLADYLAVMDSDDVSLPDRIEEQVRFLQQHPDYALVGGNLLIIDEQSRIIGERRYPTSDKAIRRVITRYNPFAQPTVLMRPSAITAVGGYDERFPRCQDYDLWFRLAANYKVANLDRFTLKYRVSATQGKTRQLKSSLRHTIEIQKEWMFRREFFRPLNIAYVGLEHALLLAPDLVVLALFKTMTYRRHRST